MLLSPHKTTPVHIKQQEEDSLRRSISLVQLYFADKSKSFQELLACFYYALKQLNSYALKYSEEYELDRHLFNTYKSTFDKFSDRNFSQIKENEMKIIQEMCLLMNNEPLSACLHQALKEDVEGIQHPTVRTLNLSNIPHTHLHKIQQPSKTTRRLEASKLQKQLYDQMMKAYDDHKLDQAYALNQKIKSNEKNMVEKTLTVELLKQLNDIEFEYQEMIKYYKYFDEPGWIFDKESSGVTLHYKMFEKEKQISVLIQSELDITIENFMAMLGEMDLFELYVPFCYDSKELKRISRNEAIGTSKVYIPMLTDRETFFYATGYDRIKTNGSIFFYSKTINEDKVYQKKYGFEVPPPDKYIRLQYNFFIVEYIPVTIRRAKVRIASNVDLKMNFLPNWILSMSARKFAFDYFVNIVKLQKQFHKSPWIQKIESNPELYGFFKQKIAQHFST